MSRFLLALAFVSTLVSAQFVTELSIRQVVVNPARHRSLAPLSTERHAVTAKVEEGVVTTTVRQTFRNPNAVELEGTYLFALPDQAAISGFAMSMGGKMVSGELLDRDKAAGIYEAIVARARDPGLLEYMGRRLFRARVFPIPATGTMDIELTYSETLSATAGMLEWRYPLKTQAGGAPTTGQTTIVAEIASKGALKVIHSPTHQVTVTRSGDRSAKVVLEERGTKADTDFVLYIGQGEGDVGASFVSHSDGDHGNFLLMLAPAVQPAAAMRPAQDIIFVADTSGSMAGVKMEQLRKTLIQCLQSLEAGDRFELISFSTEARPLNGKLTDVSSESVKRAVSFVGDLKPVGGTAIHDALVAALKISGDGDRPLQLLFLTDGRPTVGLTDPESLVKDIAGKCPKRVRLSVFGIGGDVNATLLDRMAEQNRGTRDYVAESEDLELKVSTFFAKVSRPVLSDIKVTFEGLEVKDVFPRDVPDLFRGTQLTLAGSWKGKGTVKVNLEGRVNTTPFATSWTFAVDSASVQPSVARLWATRKVGWLMDLIRLNGESKELRDEIVSLGVRHGIVTPYTSFLITEDIPTAGVQPPQNPGHWRGGQPGGGGGATRGETGGRGLDVGGVRRDAAGAPGTLGAPAPSAAAPRDATGGLESGLRDRLRSAEGKKLPDQEGEQLFEEAKSKANAAGDEFRKLYESGDINLSLRLKDLRESDVARRGQLQATIRNVASRVFWERSGIFIEGAALNLPAEDLDRKLVAIEQWSPAWFELAKRPGWGAVLALGSNIIAIDGDRVVQILPAKPASRPSD